MLYFSMMLLAAALLLVKSFVRSLNSSSVVDDGGVGRGSDVDEG